MNKKLLVILVCFTIWSCEFKHRFQLVVTNASLFNVHTKETEPNKTVVVNGGKIIRIIDSENLEIHTADKVIDANGRLLTPGFIDVHHHSMSILSDSVSSDGGGPLASLTMHPDSISSYRKILASEYMPYGVTTVREAGGSEDYLPMMLAWMKPDPDFPDFYPVGGAIVSHEEDRTPYAGHVVVRDSLEAAIKIQQYHDLGIRHIKLYWRLRKPEFDAALKKAQELGMNICGHIDYKVVSIEHALEMGLNNFEHAYTLAVEVMNKSEIEKLWERPMMKLTKETGKGLYFMYVMEHFNYIGRRNQKMLALINIFKQNRASITPTLHIFAQRFGLTYFTSKPTSDFDDTYDFTEEQLEIARTGYDILASYVKQMFDEGIQLNLGTDSQDPGRAALSEMLLMNQLGIPMPDVITIATLNSAKSIGLDELYGSIEVDKKANFVLFEKSPLEEAKNLLSQKVVVKDGVVWNPQ